MTEKRLNIDLIEDLFVREELIRLYEENEQLQIEKNTLKKQHTYELTKKLEYKSKLIDLKKENEQLKEHQRTIEAKIVRLKDRVKTFEKNYSLKDIERYKKMENCNCITAKRLEE